MQMKLGRKLVTSLDSSDLDSKRARWFWAVLIAAVAVHLSTLTLSPTIWQDEVQTVDWGRATIIDPTTTWSVDMLEDGRNVPMVSFVGPLVQEIGYRLFAPWTGGPRLFSLVAACAAMLMFFHWLRLRGNRRWEAFLATALLFMEPAFMQSYRGARADAWAMLACFSALALLRLESRTRPRFAAVGALVALAQFFWPSAVMLIPLVLVELYLVLVAVHARSGLSGVIQALAGAAVGGSVVVCALIAVVIWRNPETFQLTAAMLGPQFGARPQSMLERLQAFWITARTSPVTLLALALLALRAPGRAITLAAVVELGVLFTGLMYANRILYFMPYAAVVVADALRHANDRWRPTVAAFSIVALVLAAPSLGVRTIVALDQRQGRDPARLEEFARRVIGAQPARVYLEAFDFYFVGRELGWHMIRPYPQTDNNADAFRGVDYAIVGRGGKVEADFLRAGMRLAASMERPAAARSIFSVLGGARPYGDFDCLVSPDRKP